MFLYLKSYFFPFHSFRLDFTIVLLLVQTAVHFTSTSTSIRHLYGSLLRLNCVCVGFRTALVTAPSLHLLSYRRSRLCSTVQNETKYSKKAPEDPAPLTGSREIDFANRKKSQMEKPRCAVGGGYAHTT